MADWDDVRAAVAGLPDVAEGDGDTVGWAVHGKGFLWERPLRKGDLTALGPAVRDAPVLAAMVSDLEERAALIAEDDEVFFVTPHFQNYPAVLIWLDRISPSLLAEVAVDAWLAKAPARLAKAFLADRGLSAQ